MRTFCTYFDHNYLGRGIALYESLVRHCVDFELWVLALSPECDATLRRLALPRLRVVSLDELERDDPELAEKKHDRTRVEYYFTCTPAWPRWILARDPSVDLITYLDADLWFFASPEIVFQAIGDRSIAIVPHRFSDVNRQFAIYGTFNVGWVSFRADEDGRACLDWWRARCLEWCHDRAEDGRFADQGYLDEWPTRFRSVAIIEHRGVNAAPWNLGASPIEERSGGLVAGGDPLVFYHFHGLKRVGPAVYDPHLVGYGAALTPVLRRRVYGPYVHSLERLRRRLGRHDVAVDLRHKRDGAPTRMTRARAGYRILRGVAKGEYVVDARFGLSWPSG